MNRARPGLSLVEVLVAVLIVGISVTTILSLQGVLSRGVFSVHATINRMPFIRSLFAEADRDKLFKNDDSHVKTIEHPAVRLTYSLEAKLPKSLSAFKQLKLEKVEADWSTGFGTCKQVFTRLRFVPQAEGG